MEQPQGAPGANDATTSARLQWAERLLNTMPGYVYVYNAVEQRNVYANRNMGQLLGYTPEELQQMGSALLATVMHPDDFARLPEQFQRILAAADDAVVEWEYRVRDRTGAWFWLHDRISIFSRDAQGNVVEYVGVVQEITGRKQTEQHLQESQQRLEFALAGSGDCTWDWNITTNEARLSNRYREMLGYAPDELPNSFEAWFNRIHPEDVPGVQQYLQDYLEGRRETYVIEHRLQHKSGEWLWMLSRGKVILRDEQGAPLRMTGTISDIHTRKQREDQLRAFKSLVETAPDGIGISRMDSTITYANPALQVLTGYGEAVVGMDFLQLYSEEERLKADEVAEQLFTQGAWQGPLLLQHAQGQRVPIQLTAFVIRDKQGQPVGMTGIFRDMTAQLRAEEERVALQQQIIETQRNTLRELSTPLIPITNEVMIMPLIGTIDSGRAQMVLEALLEGVARHQASLVILDITGVAVVDTQVAQSFIQAAQAVKLLGAEVMLTGIQPQIAQTLVHLGIDLSGILTRGSLQAGIAAALAPR